MQHFVRWTGENYIPKHDLLALVSTPPGPFSWRAYFVSSLHAVVTVERRAKAAEQFCLGGEGPVELAEKLRGLKSWGAVEKAFIDVFGVDRILRPEEAVPEEWLALHEKK